MLNKTLGKYFGFSDNTRNISTNKRVKSGSQSTESLQSGDRSGMIKPLCKLELVIQQVKVQALA